MLQAIWISDSVLGIRSVETRATFINQLQAECTEAAPEDMQWLVRPVKEESSVASGPQLFKSKPALSASTKDQERTASFRATTDSTSKTWPVLRLLTCKSLEGTPAWRQDHSGSASILCVRVICCAACHASFVACRVLDRGR